MAFGALSVAGALPKYVDLLVRTDAPPGSSWGVFGSEDELGTINFLTSERTLRAAACVRTGKVVNLDCSLDTFEPPISPSRRPLQHVIYENHVRHFDDYLDSFFMQAGTHIDGLRHMRHPEFGFYNGLCNAGLTEDDHRLGIARWAEAGIVGRGILADVEAYLQTQGHRLDQSAGEPISLQTLLRTLEYQNTSVRPGDILLLRTGWLNYYRTQLGEVARTELRRQLRAPGLEQGHEILAWLWENEVGLVAADNPGLEVFPPVERSPFRNAAAAERDGVRNGWMHPTMIALLGFAVGELWDFDRLSSDCRADGRYDSLVVAKPLNLPGGVGSPANAVAIR